MKAAKFQVHDAPEHYGEEFEIPSSHAAEKGIPPWAFMVGTVVIACVVLGLVLAVIRLAAAKKERHGFFA